MMAQVWIPSLLRSLTDNQDVVRVGGKTVGQVLQELDQRFPGIRSRLSDGDALKPGITVAVDSRMARLGLQEPVEDQSEIHFIPAIAGGT